MVCIRRPSAWRTLVEALQPNRPLLAASRYVRCPLLTGQLPDSVVGLLTVGTHWYEGRQPLVVGVVKLLGYIWGVPLKRSCRCRDGLPIETRSCISKAGRLCTISGVNLAI